MHIYYRHFCFYLIVPAISVSSVHQLRPLHFGVRICFCSVGTGHERVIENHGHHLLLVISGTKAIRADWVHPDELNGVLERYVLFASDSSINEIGNEVYNSSDSFTYYSISDLTPGTTYYIRLSVSKTVNNASNFTIETSKANCKTQSFSMNRAFCLKYKNI